MTKLGNADGAGIAADFAAAIGRQVVDEWRQAWQSLVHACRGFAQGSPAFTLTFRLAGFQEAIGRARLYRIDAQALYSSIPLAQRLEVGETLGVWKARLLLGQTLGQPKPLPA